MNSPVSQVLVALADGLSEGRWSPDTALDAALNTLSAGEPISVTDDAWLALAALLPTEGPGRSHDDALHRAASSAPTPASPLHRMWGVYSDENNTRLADTVNSVAPQAQCVYADDAFLSADPTGFLLLVTALRAALTDSGVVSDLSGDDISSVTEALAHVDAWLDLIGARPGEAAQ